MLAISSGTIPLLTLKFQWQEAKDFFDECSLIYLSLATHQTVNFECHHKPILR